VKNSNYIGVYGGSFDPVHLGHLRFAELSIEIFNLEKIIFIPTYNLPHTYKNRVSHYDLRYKMLELAISDNKKFEVSDIESKRKGKSYTIDTLNEMKKIYSEKKIVFLMGSDSFLKINTWKSWKDLINNFTHIIAVRPGAEMYRIKKIIKKYDLDYSVFTKENKELTDLKNLNILKDRTILDISSTVIRARIKKGESIRYLVPEKLNDFILSNNLYKEEPFG